MDYKFIKTGVFFLVLFSVSLLFFAVVNHAQPYQEACDPDNHQSVCGQFINAEGHGAVELCENCFVCGDDDGVCPMDYSDGTLTQKDRMLKVPSAPGSTSDYRHAYETGNNACGAVGGSCTQIRRSLDGDSWSSTGIGCGEDITESVGADSYYYKAVCDDVPRVASCVYCPDPDCGTNVKGVAYNAETGERMSDVVVRIYSEANSNIDSSIHSPSGFFDSTQDTGLEPVAGYVTIMCTSPQFFPHEREVFLQRGENVVNCPMERAECSPSCTLPDDDGVEVCSAICQGQGGCEYPEDVVYDGTSYSPEEIAEMCDGLSPSPDTFLPLGPNVTNPDYVDGIQCCTQGLVSRFMPKFELEGEDIRNLITRNFRRDLDGQPVTLKIIVYDR